MDINFDRYDARPGGSNQLRGESNRLLPTGAANPFQVRERIGELLARFPKTKFIAHFHDTRGNGILNSFTALELGLEFVDTSTGAIGGQPQPKSESKKYQAGFTGNTCTEDLAALLAELGVETGLDMEKVVANGRRAEEVVGYPLRSNVIRSGPVNHRPKAFAAG